MLDKNNPEPHSGDYRVILITAKWHKPGSNRLIKEKLRCHFGEKVRHVLEQALIIELGVCENRPGTISGDDEDDGFEPSTMAKL